MRSPQNFRARIGDGTGFCGRPPVGPSPVRAGGTSGTSRDAEVLQTRARSLYGDFNDALRNHIVPTTRRNYDAMARQYVTFCEQYGLAPWPATALKVSMWVIRLMTSVAPSSLRVYLAAVRDAHILEGYKWTLLGDETLRRVLRFVKRKHPSDPAMRKAPVTVEALQCILPLLPGWPNLAALRYDDILFACASVIGVCGFLRGGEFLHRRGQARPVLQFKHMTLMTVNGQETLVVKVPQAKAEWWRTASWVPLYGDRGPFGPRCLWEAFCDKSPFIVRGEPTKTDLPAFHHSDGKPLAQEWMVKRTLTLFAEAKIKLQDERGHELKLKAASWRAGGVQSAVRSGIGEATIKELGRWHSSAWERYLVHTGQDLARASAQMWRGADQDAPPHPLCLRVGASSGEPGPSLRAEDERSAQQVEREMKKQREKHQEIVVTVRHEAEAVAQTLLECNENKKASEGTKKKGSKTTAPKASVGQKKRKSLEATPERGKRVKTPTRGDVVYVVRKGQLWGDAQVTRVNGDDTVNLRWPGYPGEYSVEIDALRRAR